MQGFSGFSTLAGVVLSLGVGVAGLSAAHADDPNDRTMRSAAARARDAAQIRKLNQDQLAYVHQRDARYAQGWEEYRRYHEGEHTRSDNGYAASSESSDDGYSASQDEYARARNDYEVALADWRRDVSACRAGYYEHCAH